MLDALRLEHLMNGVRRLRQAAIDIATCVLADAEHVAGGVPHGDGGAWLQRGDGVGDGLVHLVADLDGRSRSTRQLARLGHHHGQDVARIAGASPDGDHDRPVLVDDADQQLAGQIGGREDRGGRRASPWPR